jgi:O-antigen/teichoic acid export membrane protein
MTEPVAPTSPTVVTARSTAGVGVASIVAAGSAYLVLVIVGRTLSLADTADFLTFWSLLFFVFGTLGGLQNETIRAVHVSVEEGTTTQGSRAPVVGLAVGLALAALVLVSGPLWADSVLSPDPLRLTVVVAVGAVAFAGHSAVAGTLGGTARWHAFSGLVAGEAVTRLALVAGAALLGAGVVGLATAVAGAAATWLLASTVPTVRHALGVRTGASVTQMLRPTGLALLGAASNAALVVGFTVLLQATTDPVVFRTTAAPLVMAVLATRAPLLVPLGAYQGMAITYVLRHRADGLRPLVRIAAFIMAVGVAVAGLAALLGPWLMAAVLGEEYRVPALLLFELTLAATVLALLAMTGAAALAVRAHLAFSLGWLTATATTFLCLLLPTDIETRTVVSLVAGPLVGVVVHVVAVRRAFVGRR